MCLAIPGQITEIKENKKAVVNFSSLKKTVDTTFIEDPAIGDWVLVHVGCAIQKVEEEAAHETYRLLAESRPQELKDELAQAK
ncbi:MAG: HypC/HybG/HupF family hydrogenase formation chaperone [Candidatus Pacebacteria bacterium]|jgi:hydrogenase expression/formation protein HypC|nr:HypC/HybG/HupF family hydrogenase formation chaperone [Candidatus Paceibacterota bacterium]